MREHHRGFESYRTHQSEDEEINDLADWTPVPQEPTCDPEERDIFDKDLDPPREYGPKSLDEAQDLLNGRIQLNGPEPDSPEHGISAQGVDI